MGHSFVTSHKFDQNFPPSSLSSNINALVMVKWGHLCLIPFNKCDHVLPVFLLLVQVQTMPVAVLAVFQIGQGFATSEFFSANKKQFLQEMTKQKTWQELKMTWISDMFVIQFFFWETTKHEEMVPVDAATRSEPTKKHEEMTNKYLQ